MRKYQYLFYCSIFLLLTIKTLISLPTYIYTLITEKNVSLILVQPNLLSQQKNGCKSTSKHFVVSQSNSFRSLRLNLSKEFTF